MEISDRPANRLIKEKSPYLLQHAYNPVDWYPWCDEAFARAKTEKKPIFLSIGYSTCHWCHVMARESFEDKEVAEILNENFISIKVDREERPDVDAIYMNVCQAITGQGGWPLTIVMTPDKRPFFAGTYFPKEDRWGRMGLKNVLKKLIKLWKNDRNSIDSVSREIVQMLKRQMDVGNESITESVLKNAFQQYYDSFDKTYGGFGKAPKFPAPHNLLFLLRYWYKTRDERPLLMVEKTLCSIAAGGIFDHIGFGFHRYSTDEKWLVPHFEKMLYDNALLSYVYTEAYEATGKSLYREIAEKTFHYILENMTSPEGGFYSAQDADSESVEGKFYVWMPEEVINVLGSDDGLWFCDVFDITPKGNFEGKSIPNLLNSGSDCVDKEKFEKCRKRLYAAREKRVHPHTDDKILTSWNGLMIGALAKGARVLKDKSLCRLAEKTVSFIVSNLVNENGRLLKSYRKGEADILAYVDDYAFLIWGLIELYETTFKPHYLEKAIKLNDQMLNLFWDNARGGFYLSGSDAEKLIVRPKEVYDGAVPSGNSVAALNLLKLSQITGDVKLSEKARQLFDAFAGIVKTYPAACGFLLTALLLAFGKSREIVIVGNLGDEKTQSVIDKIRSYYMPDAVIILNPGGREREEIVKLVPFLREIDSEIKKQKNNNVKVFVCSNQTCLKPVTDIKDLDEVLASF